MEDPDEPKTISMTRDEFLEKCGYCLVSFSGYYKYSFMFTRVLDNGDLLAVSVGGDHDDIYRLSVGRKEVRVNSLDFSFGTVTEQASSRVLFVYDDL